jgi:hypothetical protein
LLTLLARNGLTSQEAAARGEKQKSGEDRGAKTKDKSGRYALPPLGGRAARACPDMKSEQARGAPDQED